MRPLLLLLLLSLGAEAFANNYFIPNHYRGRRGLNSGPAIGWSDRREVNLAFEKAETETRSNGTKSKVEEDAFSRAQLFYRTPVNLNIEALVQLEEGEERPVSSAQSSSEGVFTVINLGYEFTTAPMVISASYFGYDEDEKDRATGVTSNIESRNYDLGYGLRLGEGFYLGALYRHAINDGTNLTEDKNNYYHVGAGQIFGDQKDPAGGFEGVFSFWNENNTQSYGLLARAFYNQGRLQYYGSANYATRAGRYKGRSYGATLGADVTFGIFFVGPQISYTYFHSGSSPNDIGSKDWGSSLMAGARTERFEVAVDYRLTEGKEDNGPASPNDESESNTWTLQASLFF